MLSIWADALECVVRTETLRIYLNDLDGHLTSFVDKLNMLGPTLNDRLADLECRSCRENVRIHGIYENGKMANPLPYLPVAIPKCIVELGSVEIMHAHRMGSTREDANRKPISHTLSEVAEIYQQR